jgi:pimeloyl-ACP methyl ester carboxylesterase
VTLANNIIHLSGWGQDNSLYGYDNFDYYSYKNIDELFSNIPKFCDKLIGWSLGGQIAIRLIASGKIKTNHLILLATPYKFPQDNRKEFRDNFIANPDKTLGYFRKLMVLGDKNRTFKDLSIRKDNDNGLCWLDELYNFSCNDIDFSIFPKIDIIHGENDVIVPVEQAIILSSIIPRSRLHIIKDSGHIPQIPECIL